MEFPRGSLGAAIKKAREDKNLTQERLAEIIGISTAHMKQVENERRNPSVDLLYELVLALDFSFDYMFSNPDEDAQELIHKINLCLDRCDAHELQVAYATIEAMLKRGEKAADEE